MPTNTIDEIIEAAKRERGLWSNLPTNSLIDRSQFSPQVMDTANILALLSVLVAVLEDAKYANRMYDRESKKPTVRGVSIQAETTLNIACETWAGEQGVGTHATYTMDDGVPYCDTCRRFWPCETSRAAQKGADDDR